MIKSLLGRRQPLPKAPPQTCLYAIGDIHGRADLLSRLLGDIAEDAAAYQGLRKVLITLGDYVDRGPDSRGVIDLLLSRSLPDFDYVHLLGNHEDLMLRFLERPATVSDWIMNGGDATLESYGVSLPPGWQQREAATALRDRFSAALPAAHFEFIRDLDVAHFEGDYMFVHAGIRPGLDPMAQDITDMIWIRDEFLRSKRDHGRVIVHGHSVRYEPEVWPSEKRPNRIGIDTGAYLTGRLTCLVLVGESRSMISTPPNARFAPDSR